jgi:hypothetical protein
VCGIAADISPIENSIPKYMSVTTRNAIAMPPKPAKSRPKFHPEKSPEMTAAIPRPQSPQSPADRFRLRFSK